MKIFPKVNKPCTIIILFALLLTSCGTPTPEAEQALAESSVTLPGGESELICADGSVPDPISVSGGKLTVQCAEDETPPTELPSETETPSPGDTATPELTATMDHGMTDTPEPTSTFAPTDTLIPPSVTVPAVTPTSGTPITAFRDAPLCPDSGGAHNNSVPHSIWDSVRGCHYDHEHGASPFTADVAAAFPGMNLTALLGGVGIGHTNPSSPMENTHKHGGFKWAVSTAAPQGCAVGFEGGTVAVDAYAIQYHSFGQQSIEFEARNHSAAALLRQCKASNPSDKGYIYTVQLQEYGQRTTPYQGYLLSYPDYYPAQGFTWYSTRGPYLTTGCVGNDIPVPAGVRDLNGGAAFTADCATSLQEMISLNRNSNSIWTSKPTGNGLRPQTPKLFRLLFRIRDNYQLLDSADLVHPFTWRFICSSDNGVTYNASMPGCRWNNTTTTIHEIMGDIPAAWDGLAGFDTDSRPGRITAQGFTTLFGDLRTSCTSAYSATFQTTPDGVIVNDPGCYPIKMISAFVGRYSSDLCLEKCSNPNPKNTPERDIYFCNNIPCPEYQTSNPTQINPAAVPSGWLGVNN